MLLNKDSKFYITARKRLEEYTAQGKSVDELTKKDDLYRYILFNKIYIDEGTELDLEAKFDWFGYPRKRKMTKNLREELIAEIKDYLIDGGNLHIRRKDLPFYDRLHAYQRALQKKGINLTCEQIMKEDFGFKEYSDEYFRCKNLEQIKYFRDSEGFVDDFRENKKFNAYVKDVGITYGVPYYLIITLLMDEKLKACEIETDKIKYTHALLKQYAEENGSFVGLRRNDPVLYNALDMLTRYYSDGSEQQFSKLDWLEIFDLNHIDNRFRDTKQDEQIDIEPIMIRLREEYKGRIINPKDLDSKDYRLIIKKAVAMGISVSEIFEIHDLKADSRHIKRLSRVKVTQIPYYEEMKERRNVLIKEYLKSKIKPCKEEIFEAKLLAVIQTYKEYKEKIETYYPGDLVSNEELIEETTFD